MGLLAPLALGLAGLSLPVVALYLLKIRRRERVVSSTLLWDRVARDLEANAPWQRFRPNWLLLLQLLALLALVAALARPYLRVEAALGPATVVVVDVSASMAAEDVEDSRIGAARREVRTLVERLPSGGRMMLAVAGAQARVAQPMTGDRAALRAATDALRPEHGQAALADALALAGQAAARLPDGAVVLVSDGDAPPEVLAAVPVPVRHVRVGSEAPENLAITTMAVGRGAAGTELFLRVLNAGPAERAARVTVTAEPGGAVVAAQDITLPAGAETALTFPDPPPAATVLRAELSAEGRDDLATDDVAWARTRAGERARVLLLTPGNLYLERGLGLLPELEVSLAAPAGGVPPGYDLYVFDGLAPPAGFAAAALLLNPPPANGVVETTGELPAPAITGVRRDDPLLAGVDLGDTAIAAAVKLVAPPWAVPLVTSGPDPLLLAGQRDGLPTAVLAFDLHRSDLPLQSAFPVLLANLTAWLLPATAATATAAVSPGEPITLTPRVGADTVVVAGPDGDRATIPARPEVLFAATAQPGPYAVEDRQGETVLRAGGFVVNLLDRAESDLAPTAGSPEGDGTAAGAPPEGEGSGDARRFLWGPAIGLGIGLLATEWWAFYRGRRVPRVTAFNGLSARVRRWRAPWTRR